MDQAILVEQQIDDGQELIDLLVGDGFAVSAAAWVKPADEDHWLLYIVSREVDERGLSAAYRALHPVLGRLQAPWVSLPDLRLVSVSDPVAADIVEINKKYPGRVPTRTRRPQVGGMAIDEAYVYPKPGQIPPWFEKVKRSHPSAEAVSIAVPFADIGFPMLSRYMGHVNATEFMGKPPGTVLFFGPEGKSSRPVGKLHFVYRPEGWNTAVGQPPYQSADFSDFVGANSEV